METYSQKPVTFMYFWLNYCDDHIERIPIVVKDMDTFEINKADRPHLFLLSDGN